MEIEVNKLCDENEILKEANKKIEKQRPGKAYGGKPFNRDSDTKKESPPIINTSDHNSRMVEMMKAFMTGEQQPNTRLELTDGRSINPHHKLLIRLETIFKTKLKSQLISGIMGHRGCHFCMGLMEKLSHSSPNRTIFPHLQISDNQERNYVMKMQD